MGPKDTEKSNETDRLNSIAKEMKKSNLMARKEVEKSNSTARET
jgi:hypothetical protein